MMKPQARNATLWVTRTFPDGTQTAAEEALEVKAFDGTPAEVRVTASRTINLGNYESLRIEAGVSLPCYAEEVERGLEVGSNIVGKIIENEETKIRKALKA
jgi:hypothetical protein